MTASMFCGPVQLGDAPMLRDFARQAFAAEQQDGLVPRDRSPLDLSSGAIGLLVRQRPVGVAVFYDCGQQRVWLDFLFVAPDHRRRGHGRALLAELHRQAIASGFRRIMLGTSPVNGAMQGLAHAAGYGIEMMQYGVDLA